MGTELGRLLIHIMTGWSRLIYLLIDMLIKIIMRIPLRKLECNNSLQMDVLNFMFHIKPTIAVGFTAKVPISNKC